MEQRSSSPSSTQAHAQDPAAATTAYPRCGRRSIFHSYWQKKSSCTTSAVDNGFTDSLVREGGGRRSSKLEPSYLGVYSFVPLKPKPWHQSSPPGLIPIGGSTDSITPSSPLSHPPCLKPILRRCQQSGRCDNLCIGQSSPNPTTSQNQFSVGPLPFLDDDTSESCDNIDTNATSRVVNVKRRPTSMVHFDPTITVHECVVEVDSISSDCGNWFSENELRAFLHETMNICRSSAMNAHKAYCLPEVKKAYDTAHEVGIKCPVLSSTYSTHRALFAEEVLHATDEDAIVHDGSFKFFQLIKEEVQRVLIVDTSLSSRKLLRRHILAMFPHAHIDVASSGEDVLDKIDVCYDRGCINYDLVVVEEHLHQCDEDATATSISFNLTGSELLRLLNEMEDIAVIGLETCDKPSRKLDSRKSLKIGVSVSLGRDCLSLRHKGGADIFWSKPPPKPSNLLRNQVLNALLSKRGSAVFVCGC